MVKYSVLGSGSSGNSYVFYAEGTSILIDLGFSLKEEERRLSMIDINLNSVEALFLTHLHPDHAHGAGVFFRKTGKPIFVNETSIKGCTEKEFIKLRIRKENFQPLIVGEKKRIGPFEIFSFNTSHDSLGSVGYSINYEDKNFLIVTDTGCYNSEMIEYGKKANVLFLESNYSEKMLQNGPYPYNLKKRIAGERGHLSNKQAEDFLEESGCVDRQIPIYLIHLSSTNNNKEKLEEVYSDKKWLTVCGKKMQYYGILP